MSPLSSPNVRNAIAILAVAITILGAAVGYGTLRAEVSKNSEAIGDLRDEVREAKSNAGASAAGASLQAQIAELGRRLDRIENRQERMEAQNNEIIKLLTRLGRSQ